MTSHRFKNSFHVLAILNNDARSTDVLLVVAFNLRGICLEVLTFFIKWWIVAKAGPVLESWEAENQEDNPQLNPSEGSLSKNNHQCTMNLFAVFVFKCCRKNKQTFLCGFIFYLKKRSLKAIPGSRSNFFFPISSYKPNLQFPFTPITPQLLSLVLWKWVC